MKRHEHNQFFKQRPRKVKVMRIAQQARHLNPHHMVQQPPSSRAFR
jgi:hypothetical protein